MVGSGCFDGSMKALCDSNARLLAQHSKIGVLPLRQLSICRASVTQTCYFDKENDLYYVLVLRTCITFPAFFRCGEHG